MELESEGVVAPIMIAMITRNDNAENFLQCCLNTAGSGRSAFHIEPRPEFEPALTPAAAAAAAALTSRATTSSAPSWPATSAAVNPLASTAAASAPAARSAEVTATERLRAA